MKHSTRQAWLFLLPWAVGFVALFLFPMAASLLISFARVERAHDPAVGADAELPRWRLTWVGYSHYAHALGVSRDAATSAEGHSHSRQPSGSTGDPLLFKAMGNSLFYTAIGVPLGLCCSLAVAMLLHQSLFGMSIFRACIYLPHVLGGVATIVIWSWLLNPRYGWINEVVRLTYAALDPIIRSIGLGGTRDWRVPLWLNSPSGCKPAVILMYVWTMGGSLIVFLAALRRVPVRLLEAAALDGASAWRRFSTVTLPHISPAILLNVTISTVFAMQSFGEAYLLENRQQEDGLLFYVLYLYRTAFEPPYRLGYACALGWILLFALSLLILPILLTSRRWVYYASHREAN